MRDFEAGATRSIAWRSGGPGGVGIDAFVHDPEAPPLEGFDEYGIQPHQWSGLPRADARSATVAHDEYLRRPVTHLFDSLDPGGSFADVKALLMPTN